MNIQELLKKENVDKIFVNKNATGNHKNNAYKVIDKNGNDGLYLGDELGNMVFLGEWAFNANFELLAKKTGWVNDFESAEKGDRLFAINTVDKVERYTFEGDDIDIDLINSSNAFTTKEKAKEINKEQLLYRKMKKFRDENDEFVDWLNENKSAFYVYWSAKIKDFIVSSYISIRELHGIYFTTEELATRCLNEVVKPFYNEV